MKRNASGFYTPPMKRNKCFSLPASAKRHRAPHVPGRETDVPSSRTAARTARTARTAHVCSTTVAVHSVPGSTYRGTRTAPQWTGGTLLAPNWHCGVLKFQMRF